MKSRRMIKAGHVERIGRFKCIGHIKLRESTNPSQYSNSIGAERQEFDSLHEQGLICSQLHAVGSKIRPASYSICLWRYFAEGKEAA
jgi:hypothetical protein